MGPETSVELTQMQVNQIAAALVSAPEFRSMLHTVAEEFMSPLRMTFVTKDEATLIANQALNGRLTGRVTRDEMTAALANSMGTISTKFKNQLNTLIGPLTTETAKLTGKLDAFLTIRQDALVDVRETTAELAKTQSMITENMARLTEQVEQIHQEVWGDPSRPDDQPSLHKRIDMLNEKLNEKLSELDRKKMNVTNVQPVIDWAVASKAAQEKIEAQAMERRIAADLRRVRVRALVGFVANPRMLAVIGLSGGTASAVIKFLEALFQ